jgi:hypothetical protein
LATIRAFDQIPPLENENLGGDCPAVLKLNGKRPACRLLVSDSVALSLSAKALRFERLATPCH